MGSTLNYYAEGFFTLSKIKQVLRDIRKAFTVTEEFSPKTSNLGGAMLRDTPIDKLLRSNDIKVSSVWLIEARIKCSDDLGEVRAILEEGDRDFKRFDFVYAGVRFQRHGMSQTPTRSEDIQVGFLREHQNRVPRIICRTHLQGDAARLEYFRELISMAHLPLRIERRKGSWQFVYLKGSPGCINPPDQIRPEVPDSFDCMVPRAKADDFYAIVRSIVDKFADKRFHSYWSVDQDIDSKANLLHVLSVKLRQYEPREIETSFTYHLPSLEKIDALQQFEKPDFSTHVCTFRMPQEPPDWPEGERGYVKVHTTAKGHRLFFELTGFIDEREVASKLKLKLK